MKAAYDSYDYPSYWAGREYEHEDELIAIKAFLKKIPKIASILEIGAGYGRLTTTYIDKAPLIILTDPSEKLLSTAKRNLKYDKIRYIRTNLDQLNKNIKADSICLIIVVRVLHHIDDLDKAFSTIQKLLKKKGYLILEFANKRHLKAVSTEFIHGNFTFILDIFPKDVKSKLRKNKKTIPFKNYHPDIIKQKLADYGFKIVSVRSVSNFRNPAIKNLIPKKTLLKLSEKLQEPFARLCIGPSIFILAKKVK